MPSIPSRPSSFWAPATDAPATDELSDRHEVVVIGAGIIGLSTALLLAESGIDVAVVEARQPGAGTTGRSTAKASLLQGTRLSQIRSLHGSEVAAAYLEANQLGQSLVQRVCSDSGSVDHAIRDAWTFATSAKSAAHVRQERETLADLGVPAQLADPEELPFTTQAAVRLPHQWQINPTEYLAALREQLALNGGRVVWPFRVTNIEESEDETKVTSVDGRTVRARWVVLATLLPFPRRTLVFANNSPSRSYTLACRVNGPIPQGMYISADSPTHSLRTAQSDDGQVLLVGGHGHPTGKQNPTHQHIEALATWSRAYFDVLEITHRWSAQDYSSVDMLPQIGHSPFGERLLMATGMGKWGITNGSAAAHILTDIILGEQQPWAAALQPRIAGSPHGYTQLAKLNADVAANLADGWVAQPQPQAPVGIGEGMVRRHFPKPQAVSTSDGRRRVCSAVCTHMGGIVRWNDADQTWDCPLHGSVFGPDGQVREGPAVHDLESQD